MKQEYLYILYGVAALVLAVVCAATFRSIRRRQQRRRDESPDAFQEKWRSLQKQCADKSKWASVVTMADDLLDLALRKRRFKGTTEGERLTKAQRKLTNNEGAWFGHKLRSKIDSGRAGNLREKDVKQALVGIRQALKDLGVFGDGK